ncbi:Uncharacterized protein OS=Porphyromonas crevioricanis JCM 15906 GN=PORCRE_1882 PE=4 SV=1 [Gemmataceae bacterium]|nr:Uncharacterized protein OS=Porphyromonas crevioricanis JCM 15906 GN=PORCRE_1882 PE=4 SV=1 [Gemmataceae bacterium]VTT96796.1 Uncharacterized protein OS=Porphyromonas crevioricanis JCM 15906 GN=PORCRE_1882 PE=4 SV=1 [Gemmataceae bacterium]
MAMPRRGHSVEEREKFELFLFEMDDVLGLYVASAVSLGYALDDTLDSLVELERYWREAGGRQPDGTAASRAARYLGEVFRRNVGGTWRLCDKGPRYLHHGLPVLAGYASMDIEFCPTAVFSNYVASEKSGLLRTAVESHLEFRAHGGNG